MESSSGAAPSKGNFGKSALDKKPLGEVFGNKNVKITQIIYDILIINIRL
jgi:hypothetical protein